MNEKKIYIIKSCIDETYTKVALTDEQIRAIRKFIEFGDLEGEFEITSLGKEIEEW